MKKILCIVLAFFLYNATTQAQALGDNIRLGLYVMPAPTLFGAQSSLIETEGGFGFGGGIVFDYALDANQRYWIGSGIGLASINGGTTINAESGTGSYDADFRLNYVEIPLTIKMKTNEVGYITWFGQAGITLGIPRSSRYDLLVTALDSTGTVIAPVENLKAGEFVNPLNLGLTFGGGLEYSFTESTSAYAALIFNQGFSRLIKKKSPSIPAYVEDDSKITGGYLGIRLGVMF